MKSPTPPEEEREEGGIEGKEGEREGEIESRSTEKDTGGSRILSRI